MSGRDWSAVHRARVERAKATPEAAKAFNDKKAETMRRVRQRQAEAAARNLADWQEVARIGRGKVRAIALARIEELKG